MARLLFDTNHLTYLFQRAPQVILAYQESLRRGDEMVLSSIAFYEVLRGIADAPLSPADRATQLRRIRVVTRNWRRLSVGVTAARAAAEVWAVRRARGQRSPDDGDVLIIGQARIARLVLLTNDKATASDAQRFGVTVQNWY
jgi:predicted nucleic acid-binding protein